MRAFWMTPGDIILALALTAFSGAGVLAMQGRSAGAHVMVEVDGHRELELSLASDVTEIVQGPLGDTTIVIENNTVRITSSACPNKHCIRMGSIRHPGEIIVCVPNRVLISIRGGNDAESFDGVSQ